MKRIFSFVKSPFSKVFSNFAGKWNTAMEYRERIADRMLSEMLDALDGSVYHYRDKTLTPHA